MRLPFAGLLTLLLVVSCVRAPSRFTQAQPRDVLYSGLVGRWSGSVTQNGNGASRVTATELRIVPAPDHDGIELRTRQRAGSRTVEQRLGHWHFARTLDAALWGTAAPASAQAFRVIDRSGGRNGAPMQLVLESEGLTAAGTARERQVFDLSTGTLRIRKEVLGRSGDFVLREAYVFRRAE